MNDNSINDPARVNMNPVTLVLIFLQLIYMVFIAISFGNVLAYEPVELRTAVTGISQQIEGLPENGKRNIENDVYEAIANNSASNNVGEMEVIIREGSLINDYYEEFDLSYVNFVVDIPAVEQSYQVFYEWSEDPLNKYVSPDNAAAVMCVSDDLMIYDDFGCKETDRRQAIVGNMLVRYGYTLPGHDSMKLLVTPENWKDAGTKIKIEPVTCDGQCECLVATDEERRQIETEFGQFVGDLGFRLEDIEYYFDNC